MSKQEKGGRQRGKGGHDDQGHGGGHHGGAWKVAYADFTTAMMAFFMLMWILAASSPKQKRAIAQYFRSDGPLQDGGSVMTGQFEGGPGFMQMPPQDGVLKETRALEKVGEELGEALEAADREAGAGGAGGQEGEGGVGAEGGEGLKDQVTITVGDDGLIIEISDDPQDELFAVGGDDMNPAFERTLDAVAEHLKTLPNSVRLEGYTDARQYSAGAEYSNWELSVDRANAARRRLQTHGLDRGRFESVVGYGDGRLASPDDPLAPGNRRITITVLRQNPVTAGSKGKAAVEDRGFRPIGDPFTSEEDDRPAGDRTAADAAAHGRDGH